MTTSAPKRGAASGNGTRVLLAGDDFITLDVLTEAVVRHAPGVEVATLLSGFPTEPFRSVGGVHEVTGDEDALIAALAGCRAAITHTHPFSRRVLEAAGSLEVVAVTRGGPVNIDLTAARELGITVTTVPGRNAIPTAEHTVAMILAAARQLAQRHHEIVSGGWPSDHYRYDEVGPELAGATLGLVGYGAIGLRVARACLGLGMTVLVFDPYFAGELPEGVVRCDDLDSLLRASYVLTLHARLTAESQGMIGRRELALLPAGAIVVNCARGGLLDYDALADGLDSGHLFAAACDVFPDEPLPLDHRLRRTPRFTLTPHLAGASRQSAHYAADVAAADIGLFLCGQAPLHRA